MTTMHPGTWRPKGVDSLEPAAELVVRSNCNSLVIAGPGAGKTELLAQRACFLLETGACPHPKRILAISFKRDAAKNLDDRIEKRCGDLSRRFDSMTLDAFGKNIVDRFRSALPPEWKPPVGYEVMTKSLNITDMRRWFGAITIPDGLQKVDFNKSADDKIKKVFERIAFGERLPFDDPALNPLVNFFALRWWTGQLKQPAGTPSLMFPMLNRLAAFLLRRNPILLRALQDTYSHVFMDEFQDTTSAQYDVVQAAFLGSNSILTAVGDEKQRIMVWAGAMPNAFDVFSSEFSATRNHLVRNYRSAPELVGIQQTIAESIESGTPSVVPSQRTVTNGVCYVAEFSTPEQEAAYLANMIAGEIEQNGLKPRDFCILARQRAGDMVRILQTELRNRGVRLRDESELQDLLAEPMSQIVLSVLRLATRKRDPEAWEFLNHETSLICGFDPIEKGEELNAFVTKLVQTARNRSNVAGTAYDLFPAAIMNQFGEDKFRAAYRQYATPTYLTERLTLLGRHLVSTGVATLKLAIDEMIGSDIVPAMTVHKSKGLEFHTVVFLGLDDSQLWNFAKQSDEEKRGFFVALSRAITRVVFTFSDTRDGKYGRSQQNRNQIKDLYSLLKTAGVETRDLRSL